MSHTNPAIPPRPGRRPRTLRPRCPRCAGRLRRCQGELFCPDCTSYTIPPEPPPAPAWYDARTSDGAYVHGGTDLGQLAAWVRDIVSPTDDIVLTTPQGLVVAVLRGDTGAVVRVR
jgi:hypothetical protein